MATADAATGIQSAKFTYDAYGNIGMNQATGQPFRYTGRRYDAETGLYYYRARYYSSELGRFLQTDPIGYEDNMNMYGYVGNDPINNTDPTGEELVVAGDDEFVAKVQASLAIIGKTDEGAAALAQLQNSDNIHVIVQSKDGSFTTVPASISRDSNGKITATPSGTGAEDGTGTGSIISFGEKLEGASLESSTSSSLAHEIGHSTEVDSGTAILGEKGTSPVKMGTTPPGEVGAVALENAVRRFEGIEQRSAYYYRGVRRDSKLSRKRAKRKRK